MKSPQNFMPPNNIFPPRFSIHQLENLSHPSLITHFTVVQQLSVIRRDWFLQPRNYHILANPSVILGERILLVFGGVLAFERGHGPSNPIANPWGPHRQHHDMK